MKEEKETLFVPYDNEYGRCTAKQLSEETCDLSTTLCLCMHEYLTNTSSLQYMTDIL